jgi:hypothetical protein
MEVRSIEGEAFEGADTSVPVPQVPAVWVRRRPSPPPELSV